MLETRFRPLFLFPHWELVYIHSTEKNDNRTRLRANDVLLLWGAPALGQKPPCCARTNRERNYAQ